MVGSGLEGGLSWELEIRLRAENALSFLYCFCYKKELLSHALIARGRLKKEKF
jgi:hypothetical protein